MSESQSKRFIKHSSYYAIGTIARRITGFLMLPVYTNFLSPADYGIVGLLVFWNALFETVFGARFIQALPKFYHQHDEWLYRKKLLSTALLLTSTITIILCFSLYSYREFFSQLLLKDKQYSYAFALFSLNLLTIAIENYGLSFIRLQEKPGLFLIFGILKLIAQFSLNLLFLVHFDLGYLGVIYGNLSASAIFAVILGIYLIRHTGIHFDNHLAKELFKFSWPLWISGLAALYVASSNRIYLNQYASLEDVGIFVLAATFAQLIRTLFWRPINQYWQVERFKHYKPEQEVPMIYRKMFKLVTYLLFPSAIMLGLFTKTVLVLMSGSEFHESYKHVGYLCLSETLLALSVFFTFAFHVKEKTIEITKITFINATFITIVFLTLIPMFGISGATSGTLIASLFCLFITYSKSTKYYDMNIDVLGFIALLGLSILIIFVYLAFSFENIIYDLLLATFLFVIYVSVIFHLIYKDEDTKEKFEMFLNRFSKKK